MTLAFACSVASLCPFARYYAPGLPDLRQGALAHHGLVRGSSSVQVPRHAWLHWSSHPAQLPAESHSHTTCHEVLRFQVENSLLAQFLGLVQFVAVVLPICQIPWKHHIPCSVFLRFRKLRGPLSTVLAQDHSFSDFLNLHLTFMAFKDTMTMMSVVSLSINSHAGGLMML